MKTYTDTIVGTPPIGTVVLTVCGVPLSEWAIVLSIVCSIFLLIDKLPVVLQRIGAFYKWMRRGKSN